MATTITNECINCGACEPECPNTAIYAGGVPWELDGATGPAIAQDIYFIVPSKCTECVGFFDHEACAAVCPVDCCIPDPANVENEGVLLARARKLHPDETFPDDPPSRFRKPVVAPAVPAPAPDAAAPKPAAAPVATAGLRKRDGASSGKVSSGCNLRARASSTASLSRLAGSGMQQSTGHTAAHASWS